MNLRLSTSSTLSLAAVLAIVALGGCDTKPPADAAAFRARAVTFPGGIGSAQPRLSVGADGKPILSWLEPTDDGAVLRYATYDGDAFSTPRDVVRGDDLMVNWADMPSVQPITADVWAAHWLRLDPEKPGAYHIATAVSKDAGVTWSEPVQLNDDSAAAEHGFVDLFAWNGQIGAFWLDGRQLAEWSFDEPDMLLGTSLRVATLDYSGNVVAREIVDELVCDCCQPHRAMTSSGPVVAYRDRTPEEIRDVVVRRHIDGAWANPVATGAEGWKIEGCPVNGPAIAAAGDRVAVAWFTAAGNKPRVRFASSTDGAASFGPAIDLDGTGSFGQVGLVLADDGAAKVSWWRAAQGGGTDLVLRTVALDGSLGEARVLAHSAAVQPVDVPQVVKVGDGVLVAWTSLDGDTTVHVLYAQGTPPPG
ncbi:MAG TPA: hypothetical protein VN818_05870 [Gammaproteobacteria bacterium]|nr:hypothetical protein [Gammaproteobacteria bacterium]